MAASVRPRLRRFEVLPPSLYWLNIRWPPTPWPHHHGLSQIRTPGHFRHKLEVRGSNPRAPADPSGHHNVQHNLALFKKKLFWFRLTCKSKSTTCREYREKISHVRRNCFPLISCVKVYVSENASFVKNRHFEQKRIVLCQNITNSG